MTTISTTKMKVYTEIIDLGQIKKNYFLLLVACATRTRNKVAKM